MSVPFWRSCCAKTGHTVLIKSSRQFSRNAGYRCRDEWKFIRNFGHEMYRNSLLMRSLQKDTTCTSKLTECKQPKNVGKCVKRRTNKKANKQARLKMLPSIPFIHNFDFLKKLNYVVGADTNPKQRPFEDGRCLKYARQLRPADNFPMVAPAAFQPAHKLSGSGGPLNAASQALAHLPWRGREHTNWFGHDIGYKVVPKTGVVELDFVTSPIAALAAQRYEAFEPNSIFRLPEDGFRFKTFSKPKICRDGKHGALNASPCAERQRRDLRYFDLVCVKGFQPNRDISNLAPGSMRGFGRPVHRGGAVQHILDTRQDNSLNLSSSSEYLTYAGASDPIQIPRTVTDLRSREGFANNTLNEAPVAGSPRGQRHFLDPEYLNYRVNPRQYHTITAAGDLGSGKPGFHHRSKTPIIAARLGNMEAYRYLARVGAFSQANVKRNVAGEVVVTAETKQPSKIRPAGGLRSTKPSHYVPFVEMTCGLGNMEAYKYLKHFGAPLYGHFMGAARDLNKLEDANYLRRLGSTMPTKYLRRASELHQEKYMDDYKQYELEQHRVPTYFGHTPTYFGQTHAHENVAGAAVDSKYIGDSGYPRKLSVSRTGKTGSFARYSGQVGVARQAGVAADSEYIGDSGYPRKFSVSRHGKSGSFARYWDQVGVARQAGVAADSEYIGDSGYLRKSSVSRHGKGDSFARYSGQVGVARQAGVVGTTGGRRSTDPSKYFVVHRPSINIRQSRGSRRATGLMIREAPRIMRHTVIPRRDDSSGIEADLAYIRERRLDKRYKLAPEGPFTYTKFARYVGQTFGSPPVNDHPTNAEAMEFFRRYLISSQRNRFGTFTGYEFKDPRFSRYSTQPRQGSIKDLSNAEAVKNMRRFRAPLKRPSYLDLIDSGYVRQPRILRRRTGRGPFDYTKFRRYETQIPEKGVGPKYNRRTTHRRKTLNEEEEVFDPQRWADFLTAELGYTFDPGYTGHTYPWFSDFFTDVNYGLKDMHNTAMLSSEEQRARDKARIDSLNLFYSIINRPGMEMEVSIPDEFSIPYDYHAEIKEEEKEEKENKKEKKLSLLNVAKLLKDERKKVFHPVYFHEPFDKERPWTWIQNFPKRIPNEILKLLSAESLHSIRAWQRHQTLLPEKSGDQSSPKPKQDKKKHHRNK